MDVPASPTARRRRRRWTVLDVFRSLNGGPGHRGPRSDHFDGERFFNPGTGGSARGFRDFLRWQRTRQRTPWPEWVENRAQPALPPRLDAGALALTFINHITFLIQFCGLNVLTDPVYSQRASPFRRLGPKRHRAPGLAFAALPHIDVVLISHNHYDHLDVQTLLQLQEAHSPRFMTGLGNGAFLAEFGLQAVEELDWWQESVTPSAMICLTPAQHWSSRRPRNRNRTLWGGFVVRAGGRQVFFAGDSGYGNHFKMIGERCGAIDVALLPIGAYEPRWFMQQQHMNPEDAVLAHLDLQARISVATHFGCFQLTDEGFEDPPQALARACRAHGLAADSFLVLETGETRVLGPQLFMAEARSKGKR